MHTHRLCENRVDFVRRWTLEKKLQYCPEQQHSAVQCAGSKIKCQNKNSKTLKSEHSAKLMQPQQCQVSQIDKKELKFARKQMFTLGLPSAVL